MIIAVNTRLLLKNRIEGIGRFSFEILKRITAGHPEHTFIFFFDRPWDTQFIFSENIIPVVLFPQSRHPFLWYWYFQFSITAALKRYKADIFITTDGWLSTRTPVKTLQVLHDLHYENHPEFLPWLVRKYYRYFFPKFVRKATRIVTVSDFCKNEIASRYRLDRNLIDVVYNSTREEYVPLTPEEIDATRQQYAGGVPYFLFIGPVHPRKNLVNAVSAFVKYKKESGDKAKLLVTGAAMWRNFGGMVTVSEPGILQDIVFTGYLQDEELRKVTGAALSLLYVSFYEGFGMPVLEAMSCNVPVIASNRSAIPEVAGDAALLVDPGSVDEIADAMAVICRDDDLRRSLVLKGARNLKRFSWDVSAAAFWKSVVQTLA